MSDSYVRDTEKEMKRFEGFFDDIDSSLSESFKDSYSLFMAEVGGLIDQYKESLERVEKLEGILEGVIEEYGEEG